MVWGHSGRTVARRAAVGMTAGLLALGLAPQAVGGAATTRSERDAAPAKVASVRMDRGERPDLDVRDGAGQARVSGAVLGARLRLSGSLGRRSVFDVDARTGAIRAVGRLDGFLTRPSAARPRDVVLGYVREHRRAFGLSRAEVGALRLRRAFTDTGDVRHLDFQQLVRGIPVYGAGLRAAVTRDGRLAALANGPVPGLAVRTVQPRLSARDAVTRALRDVGADRTDPGRARGQVSGPTRVTRFDGAQRASLMIFPTARGGRLGWLVNASAGVSGDYISMVDAGTGAVLTRQSTVSYDSADRRATYSGSGFVWRYFPSTLLPAGTGSQAMRAFPVDNTGARLSGNNAHVYADPSDTIVVGGTVPAAAEIPATTTGAAPQWRYPVTGDVDSWWNNCTPEFMCTWDSSTANSWQANVRQNATQVYYYVNTFHDHLQNAAAIGFTEAAGNFQVANTSGQGKGGDAVQAQVADGANTSTYTGGGTSPGGGFPDGNHIVNANMSTPQDGLPPRMQMYLFPSYTLNGTAPDTNGGDDASVIYHEYTHGMSNRLVTDPNGLPALTAFHSRAMGEAWSDFYAMDYLMASGFDADTAAIGDVQVGFYVGGGTTVPLRSEPLDCVPGTAAAACEGGATGRNDGYKFGDMGKIIGQPEVHADGEIWAQTLWEIRAKVGVAAARRLTTAGMMLMPAAPSMIDARNAMLQADNLYFSGSHSAVLWNVFARRGFGYFADVTDANDTTPGASAQLPPSCPTQCTSVTGTVADSVTGAALQGIRVGIRGHNSGLANDLYGVTNASGAFTIPNVPKSHNYVLQYGKAGFLPLQVGITVGTGPLAVGKKLVARDWASRTGGATIVASTKPDYAAFGCGPGRAIDLSQATGWGSDAPTNGSSGVTGPRSITIQLPVAVDVTQLRIDPGATCGDPANAAVRAFTIKTRSGTTGTWRTAWTNTASLTGGVYSVSAPAGTTGVNTRQVMLTMQSTQGNTSFMDMSEVVVVGRRR